KKYKSLPTGTIAGVNDYLVITNTGTVYGGREDNFQSFGYFPMVSNASGQAYGFEWLLQKKYSDIPCYGQISLAYSKSEYTAGNGITYPGQFDQRFILNIAGGYKFNENWEVSSKFRYFSGVPFTPVYRPEDNQENPGSIQNLPDEYLSSRLNSQGILDVRVDRYFNFNTWRLVLFLDVQNVLNNLYEIIPRYDFWEDKVVTNNSIGILPSIGISAEF
ncbi:MAG: TonB-dependent receptor, partial [Anaerolineales bacterium]